MQQGWLLISGCGCEIESKNYGERRTLIILFGINGVIFFAEIIVGIISDSTALIADSLNMLADASIYAIGFYTVSRSLLAKAKAAHISKGPESNHKNGWRRSVVELMLRIIKGICT